MDSFLWCLKDHFCSPFKYISMQVICMHLAMCLCYMIDKMNTAHCMHLTIIKDLSSADPAHAAGVRPATNSHSLIA